jgi:hypothetical protein
MTSNPAFSGVFGVTHEPMVTAAARGLPPGMRMNNVLTRISRYPARLSIIDLVQWAKDFKSTDERDKVYGLLGLAGEGDPTLTPDYSKPIKDLLTDLVKHSIETDRNLLSLGSNRKPYEGCKNSWFPELHGAGILGYAGKWDHMMNPYQASASLEPIITINKEEGILTATGLQLGVVNEVVGPFANDSAFGTLDGQDILGYGRRLRDEEGELFWRALIMDSDFRNLLQPVLPAPNAFDLEYRVYFALEPIPATFLPNSHHNVRYTSFVSGFGRNLGPATEDRCFFRTEGGDMGVGPFDSKVGDVVVILFGGNYPFLFRPKDKHYRLVGNAYVQGVMNGEIVQPYVDDRTLQGGQFSLC